MQYGRTPLTDEAIIASAEATREELPHRLARRVDKLQTPLQDQADMIRQVLAHRSLPFIVGSNPYIAQIYQLYESSFATLSNFPPIQSLEDNDRFTAILDELVADHANNVPVLARGEHSRPNRRATSGSALLRILRMQAISVGRSDRQFL